MKKWIIGILVATVALLAFVFYRGVYGNTRINGVKYNLTCSDSTLLDKLNSTSQKSYFADDELEKKFVVYDYDVDNILHHSTAKKFFDNLIGKSYTVDYEKIFLSEEFDSYLDEYNESKTNSEDAYIYMENDQYFVKPEVQGGKVDKASILNDVDAGVVIDLENYIINPNIFEEDLNTTAQELNDYYTWSATYTNGMVITPNADDIILNEDNTVTLDDTFVDEQIRAAVASYVTVGNAITINCSDGIQRNIGGGTWGTNVNYTEEVAALKECFHNKESVSGRVPIFSINYGEIGGTFIEISIEKQHLWYYRDNTLIVEADVVTGLPNGSRNTPTGVYYISECIKGKYLTGDDYRTWVNYWMRLTNNGVGLHDATWQTAFGADVYLTKGSHGCINLSYDFSTYIFSEAYVGMPVIIY